MFQSTSRGGTTNNLFQSLDLLQPGLKLRAHRFQLRLHVLKRSQRVVHGARFGLVQDGERRHLVPPAMTPTTIAPRLAPTNSPRINISMIAPL